MVHEVQPGFLAIHGHRVRHQPERTGGHVLGAVGEIAGKADRHLLVVLRRKGEEEGVRKDLLHDHLVPENGLEMVVERASRHIEPVPRIMADIGPFELDPDRLARPARSLPQEPVSVRPAADRGDGDIDGHVAVPLQVAFRRDRNVQHARIIPGKVAQEPDDNSEQEGGHQDKALPPAQVQPGFARHGQSVTAGSRSNP